MAEAEVSAELYYLHNGEWYESDSLLVGDAHLKAQLAKSYAEPVAYHPTASKTAWFYFNHLDAVFSLTFKVSPRLQTRQQIRKKIDEILENASNAFKVAHNPQTGLLARDKFREQLEGAIGSIPAAAGAGIAATLENQKQLTLAVLAFDIDHFKQVNDTFGHLYGDQVLKSFAMRLEQAAIVLERDIPGIKIALGHPSGEEFLAFVLGSLAQDELTFIGERFRKQIADEPLPTDDEWQVLKQQTDLTKVTLPSITQRTITTSVGVVTYNPPVLSETPHASAIGLLDKADTALYKSKAGGRNRVTLFQAILQSHGKVLEHDIETGVIVVDIGLKVGVLQGQEFRVYPPTFTGQIPFTTDDGRTKRVLGYYPRIETARIVIFETQPEISFAKFSNEAFKGIAIRAGSSLEAVPLGSFAHLITADNGKAKPAFGGEVGEIPGLPALQQHVDRLIALDQAPFAAIFSFLKQQEFLQKYGSASLNRALADLYADLGNIFSQNSMRGAVDGAAVCVVGPAKEFHSDYIEKLLASKYPTGNELEVVCGYFISTTVDVPEAGLLTSFSNSEAITFARYALGDSDNEVTKLRRFTTGTAESLLRRLSTARANSQAITDGLRLKQMGVWNPRMANLVGLAYWGESKIEEAADFFEDATKRSPANIILRGNFAQAVNRLNQVQRGLEILNQTSEADLPKMREQAAHGYVAYLVLLAKAWKEKSQLFLPERFKLMREAVINDSGLMKDTSAELVRSVDLA